jgi:hypothetical protein
MKVVLSERILETSDILSNSEIEETDLVEQFGQKYEFTVVQLAQRTYRAIYSAYRGTDRDRQKKAIQYMINTGDNKEALQETVLRAEIEYIRAALITGMDLSVYITQNSIEERILNEVTHPRSVVEILREGGLWITGRIEYVDSEIS